MSAFGLPQSNFDPNSMSANGVSGPLTIAQAVPGYQGQPAPTGVSSINWSPATTAPWQDPGKYISGWDTNSPGGLSQMFGAPTKSTPELTSDPWSNVIGSYFGSGAGGNLTQTQGRGNQWTAPTDTDPNGYAWKDSGASINPATQQPVTGNQNLHTYGYAGGFSNPAYQNQFGNNANDTYGSITNPQTLQELYSATQNMSQQQLGGAANNWDMIQKSFGLAAQNYSNAYANSNYAKQNPFSMQQTSDWLQASYNTLTNRLNASGYL